MGEHKLKCWAPYFDAVARGEKNFEVRRDDRGFQKGDVLVLQKWKPETQQYEMRNVGPTRFDYVNVEERRLITYVLTGGQFGIEPGYVVLGLAPLPPPPAEEERS